MMKRIIATLFFLFLLLGALVLVAPNFIDWNKHKGTLAAHASAYMQRNVAIGGDISFRLLPNPQLSVADVTVASIDGAKQPHFLKLRQLEARVRLQPLLQGRIEVEKIHLVGPELTLEVLDDARASWQGLTQGDKPFVFGQSGGAVKLEDVTLQDGRIRYLHAASGVDIGFDKLNFSVGASSLRGPYKIVGDMLFKEVPVNVEITTGLPAADGTGGMALNALFQPLDKLPQLSFKGHIGSDKGGVFFDGDLSMTQGSPAALFEQPLLTAPAFLNEEMRLTAELSLRAGELSLRKIAAETVKIKNGRLSGDVTLRRPPMEMPLLEANLVLSHLPLGGDKQERVPLPQGMRAKINLRGEEVLWRGARIRAFDLKAESAQDSWTVHSFKADLPGKTTLSAKGTSHSAQQTDSLRITLQSADLGAAAKTYAAILPEAAAKILPHLPAQRATLEGNLDIRPDRVSFYNFTATLGEGGKATGVINLPQKGMEAKLNLSGIVLPDLGEEQRRTLMQQIFAPETDLDITAEKQRFAGIDLHKIVLKTTTDDKGAIDIKNFSGVIDTEGRFAVQAGFSSWPPDTAERANVDYELAASDLAAVGKAVGIVWPLPLHAAAPADLRGSWSRDGAYKISGAFYGGTVDLQRTTAEMPLRLDMKLPDSHGALALFGLGIDRLVSPAGPVQLTAELSGTPDAFKLESLRLSVKDSVTTGRIEKKESGLFADLRSDNANFDRWLAADMRQSAPLSLRLRAEKAQARGLSLQKIESEMDITADAVNVKTFKAGLWGGALSATAKLLRRDDKTWTAETAGEVTALRPAQIPLGLAGLIADEGDIAFTLSAKAQDKAAFKDVSGAFSVSLPQLTVEGFAPAALTAYLLGLKGAPQDLSATAHKTLRGGAASYRDVNADFTREGDMIAVKSLSLQNAESRLKVEATLDAGASTYDLKTFVTLTGVEGLEPLVLTRAGAAAKAPDYRIPAKPLTDYAASRQPEVAPEPEPAPVAIDLPVLEDNAEMLPPGYLDVPSEGAALPSDEAGEEMIGEILPVEEEMLPQPEIQAMPEAARPEPEPQDAQDESDAIRGILDRLDE
ncbi:MAG: AsmA family protein [Alphaproteobacteria bacterium]|nr:AsmA family protein [Alphaproteobacteria bacterium]